MAYFPIKLLFPFLNLRVSEVEGLDNLPQKGPYIIACNHESSFDPVLLVSSIYNRIRQKIYFIGHYRLLIFFNPIFIKYFCGVIPVYWKNIKNEDSKLMNRLALKKMLNKLKKGKICGIFPESSRNTNKTLLKGKTGAARLALWTKSPIIPVGYRGPSTWSFWQGFKNFINYKKQITIKIGKPFYLNEFFNKEINKELLESATRKIMREVGKLCGKEYPY